MERRDRFEGQFPTVMAAARREEPWAFERIFNALSPVVTGYLRLQGGAEPEDLTSEVFLGVLRNLAGFEGDEADFRSWVFTIAHRRLLDERRRTIRRPPPEPLRPEFDRIAPDDVESEVEASMSAAHVEALCWRLVPDQRDVLLLRLLGRMTIEEVAETIGKTPGAVKALQRRGFVAIARVIETEGVPL